MNMIDKEKVINGLEMLRFFNQRAGRELWGDKQHDVQETDIANADAIFADALALLRDFEPVQHGYWVLPSVCYEDIECSVCHAYMPLPISFDYRPTYKYCPMCGAKMDEVSE